MKFAKLLALGLCVTFGLSSCLDDSDDNGNSYQTYTDYLQFNSDGSKATTDAGETFDVTVDAQSAANYKNVISKLSAGRGLAQFRVEYGTDGKMVGGLQMLNLTDCFVKPAEASYKAERNTVQAIDTRFSHISDKYANLLVTVSYDDKIELSKFHLNVTEIVGNQVKMTVSYDEERGKNSDAKAISFDYRAALAAVRDQLKPIDGKVKIILTNNDNISGDVSWSY